MSLGRELDNLAAAHGAGRALALFFDCDGTLAPLAPHPCRAAIPESTRSLLAALARRPGVTLGVLSGRTLDELQALVGLPGLLYCGQAGIEIALDERRMVCPSALEARGRLEAAAADLRRLTERFPGSWLEDKRLSLTLHYRDVASDRIAELRTALADALADHVPHLRLADGALAAEVVPALSWTKGFAVQLFLDRLDNHALPLYAGDDANDADALEVVRRRGGLALGIGPKAPPAAAHRLADPAALAAALRTLNRFLEANSPVPAGKKWK